MEIIQERLEREYDLDLVATAPSVEYELVMLNGEVRFIESPADLPDESTIAEIREPWMHVQIFAPEEFYGVVMDLARKRRGEFIKQEHPAPGRVVLHYYLPVSYTHLQSTPSRESFLSLAYFASWREISSLCLGVSFFKAATESRPPT